MLDNIQLTPQQAAAADRFGEWLEKFQSGEASRPYFVIEGYAGTGKSFSVRSIIDRFELRPQYMTFTGKAALVLNRYSQVGATTIHSAIYRLKQVPDEVFRRLYEELDGDPENEELQKEIEELKQPVFELNPEAFDDSGVELIVLDECSMVDEDMLNDLLTFGIPIIALGDPGQLPPVKGTGSLFKGVPDARLTDILRQALESPIIQWSMWARERRPLPTTDPDTWREDEASKFPKAMVDDYMALVDDHDVVICWKNKTRQNLNSFIRKKRGIGEVLPVPGERLIVTKNDRTLGIVNGQFIVVEEIGNVMDTYVEVTAWPEDEELRGEHPLQLKVLRACFEEYVNPEAWKSLRPWDFKGTHQCDFGYAITCHKAQGSQWPRVLIFEEGVFNWNKNDAQERRAEWLYTAITRAVNKFTMVAGR